MKLIKKLLEKINCLELLRTNKVYIDLAYLFKASLRKQLFIELEFYKPFIQRGSLCFDIGANVGGKSFVFNRLGAKIVAAEPDEEAFKVLKSKFGKISTIELLNIGLGESRAKRILFQAANSALSTFSDEDYLNMLKDHRFNGKVETKKKQSVEIYSLDNLIGEYGIPHYCKIATVGYELEIIKGLSIPIHCISLTCNLPYHIDKTIECIQLIDKLGKYEFNYFFSCVNNGFAASEWISAARIIEKLVEIRSVDYSNYIEVFARINAC